jgi:hypothetical protein
MTDFRKFTKKQTFFRFFAIEISLEKVFRDPCLGQRRDLAAGHTGTARTPGGAGRRGAEI